MELDKKERKKISTIYTPYFQHVLRQGFLVTTLQYSQHLINLVITITSEGSFTIQILYEFMGYLP
jgi:hypothetical protein